MLNVSLDLCVMNLSYQCCLSCGPIADIQPCLKHHFPCCFMCISFSVVPWQSSGGPPWWSRDPGWSSWESKGWLLPLASCFNCCLFPLQGDFAWISFYEVVDAALPTWQTKPQCVACLTWMPRRLVLYWETMFVSTIWGLSELINYMCWLGRCSNRLDARSISSHLQTPDKYSSEKAAKKSKVHLFLTLSGVDILENKTKVCVGKKKCSSHHPARLAFFGHEPSPLLFSLSLFLSFCCTRVLCPPSPSVPSCHPRPKSLALWRDTPPQTCTTVTCSRAGSLWV